MPQPAAMEFLLPDNRRLAFENMNWLSGVHVHGFVWLESGGLKIEFAVARYESDSVFGEATSRSPVQTLHVPLGELESVALSQGWLEPKLEVRTRGLQPLDQIRAAATDGARSRSKVRISRTLRNFSRPWSFCNRSTLWMRPRPGRAGFRELGLSTSERAGRLKDLL